MATTPAGEAAVLVVGAGPVGLTMACELARHGVACRIVDETSGPTDQSRALGIQARTLEVFENVGVADEVLAKGRKLHGLSAYADNRRIFHVTFDMEGLDTPHPFILCLPQGETERILIGRLRRHGIEVERGTKLGGFRRDEAGVTATLSGTDGRSTDVRARWLVGCDGARSVVRKTLGLTFEGAEYEEQFLLADVKLDWPRPDDEVTIVVTPEGPVVAFPLPEPGRWRLVDTSGASAGDAEPPRVVARFQALLREHGIEGVTVSDPTWTSSFRIHRRVAGTFRDGRCFIAGDAAHIHSPAGGQGMNTGIQDAYNLAWKLALVDRGDSTDSLLDSYSAERRPVVAGVVRGSDLLTRVVTLRNPVARSIRNHLVGMIGEFDFVARKISKGVSELAVGYRGSPIVLEEGSGGDLAPGDRVPDFPIEPAAGGPRRLFDLLRGPKHVLLLFEGAEPSPEGASVLEVAGRLPSLIDVHRVVRHEHPPRPSHADGSVIVDSEGDWHHHFGARSGSIVLIRPDGYLGYRASTLDPSGFEGYLGRIFRMMPRG